MSSRSGCEYLKEDAKDYKSECEYYNDAVSDDFADLVEQRKFGHEDFPSLYLMRMERQGYLTQDGRKRTQTTPGVKGRPESSKLPAIAVNQTVTAGWQPI